MTWIEGLPVVDLHYHWSWVIPAKGYCKSGCFEMVVTVPYYIIVAPFSFNEHHHPSPFVDKEKNDNLPVMNEPTSTSETWNSPILLSSVASSNNADTSLTPTLASKVSSTSTITLPFLKEHRDNSKDLTSKFSLNGGSKNRKISCSFFTVFFFDNKWKRNLQFQQKRFTGSVSWKKMAGF